MAALDHDKNHDVGDYLEESSSIQAACPWYPPTNLSTFKYKDAEECAASMESLLLGYNIMRNRQLIQKFQYLQFQFIIFQWFT